MAPNQQLGVACGLSIGAARVTNFGSLERPLDVLVLIPVTCSGAFEGSVVLSVMSPVMSRWRDTTC